MTDAVFIVGFVRSGTTAVAEAMRLAANADISVEIAPKLLVESRRHLEGRLANPRATLIAARGGLIAASRARGRVFGDKNASYLPFLPLLGGALWDSKIVFLHRDGRDAVRSLLDWHELRVHNIYTRREDGASGPDPAPEDDPWGYFYMRPAASDPLAARWPSLTRFEKCAWYWAEYNRLALHALERLDPSRWIELRLDGTEAGALGNVCRRLGFAGYDEAAAAAILGGRVNSVPQRTGHRDDFPPWQRWPAALQDQFDRLAAPMMRRLGYYRA